MTRQTPSQTIGPFFAYGLTPEQYGYAYSPIAGADLTAPAVEGERIRLEGRVLDGNGDPIGDAMIEIWQADAQGRYAHPADPRGSNTGFRGFGRCGTGTDPASRFIFQTVKPGSVDGTQAPHINVILFMRGLLLHSFTRLYFDDEGQANAADPVLRSVSDERRGTLIARREPAVAEPLYHFDIHMQGDRETVFFDV